jgi:hypothetical protein
MKEETDTGMGTRLFFDSSFIIRTFDVQCSFLKFHTSASRRLDGPAGLIREETTF